MFVLCPCRRLFDRTGALGGFFASGWSKINRGRGHVAAQKGTVSCFVLFLNFNVQHCMRRLLLFPGFQLFALVRVELRCDFCEELSFSFLHLIGSSAFESNLWFLMFQRCMRLLLLPGFYFFACVRVELCSFSAGSKFLFVHLIVVPVFSNRIFGSSICFLVWRNLLPCDLSPRL
jgi:hypothetical protein